MEIVVDLGQEWCNPKNIDLKGSGYITQGTPQGLMVLCRKESFRSDNNGGIRYIPLLFEDLTIIDESN